MALVEVEAAAARESSGWLSAPKRIKSSQLASSPRLYPAVMPAARGPRAVPRKPPAAGLLSAPRRGVCAAELHGHTQAPQTAARASAAIKTRAGHPLSEVLHQKASRS